MIVRRGWGLEVVGSRWRTALLVFLLALTMSTAVLAAGGIGMSQLALPVSQVPPAPHVSPFRVVAGVPLSDEFFDEVPAPQVAPPEFRRAGRAAGTAPAGPVDRAVGPDARRGRPPLNSPLPPAPVPSGGRPAPDSPPAAPVPGPVGQEGDGAASGDADEESDSARRGRVRAAAAQDEDQQPEGAAAHQPEHHEGKDEGGAKQGKANGAQGENGNGENGKGDSGKGNGGKGGKGA